MGAGVFGCPPRRRIAILRRSRESVFGGKPIVDGDDDRAHAPANFPALTIRGFKVADHPTAAVEHHDHRKRAVAVGPIDPRGNAAGRDVGHGSHFELRRLGLHGPEHLTPHLHGNLRQRGSVKGGELTQHVVVAGIERHVRSPRVTAGD